MRQLTKEEIKFHVSTGNITDKLVIDWLDGKVLMQINEESKAQMQENQAAIEVEKQETIEVEKQETELRPGSPELYNYLAGLYKIKTWGNV